MTSGILTNAEPSARPGPLRTTLAWHRPLVTLALAAFALTVVGLAGIALDGQQVSGAPVWLKPTKFAVSIAVYALTWAWLISLVRRYMPRHAGRWASRSGTVAAALLGLELVLIGLQAARGTTSHFNVGTSFDSAVYSVMGVSIVVVLLATLWVTVQLFRVRDLDPARALALRAGTVLTSAGAMVGFLMTAPKPGQLEAGGRIVGAHTVGLPDGGPGLPLVGWSTAGGDLRIPHFVGLHALQALPLLVLLLELLATRIGALADAAVRRRLVAVGAAGYAGFLVLLTWQALRGQPAVAPDIWTLAAGAALVVAVALCALAAVRRPVPARPGP